MAPDSRRSESCGRSSRSGARVSWLRTAGNLPSGEAFEAAEMLETSSWRLPTRPSVMAGDSRRPPWQAFVALEAASLGSNLSSTLVEPSSSIPRAEEMVPKASVVRRQSSRLRWPVRNVGVGCATGNQPLEKRFLGHFRLKKAASPARMEIFSPVERQGGFSL